MSAGTHSKDGHHAARVASPKEFYFILTLLNIATGESNATGFVVGGDNNKRIAIGLRIVKHRVEHLLKVGHLSAQIGGIVIMAGPVNLRPLNHQGKSLGIATQHSDSLLGTLCQHVATGRRRQGIALVEQSHQFLSAEARHAVESIHHRIATFGQCVERRKTILAILFQKILAATSNHHIMLALSHLKTQRIEHLPIGHMSVGGSWRSIQHTGSHHKTRTHTLPFGIVENGIVASRIGTPIHMLVVHLVARSQSRAAGGGVGAVLVARVSARETAVGEAEESRIISTLGHH